MSSLLNPESEPGHWTRHRSMHERVDACRAMLYIHRFLTDAENAKVRKRIAKWSDAARTAPAAENREGDA